jgi:predicted transposase YbfD/YdcC
VVAQRPLAGKGHERATALALVQELDLHGILLSADALHTHPAWCHCVRRQGGDYLLIAKTTSAEKPCHQIGLPYKKSHIGYII